MLAALVARASAGPSARPVRVQTSEHDRSAARAPRLEPRERAFRGAEPATCSKAARARAGRTPACPTSFARAADLPAQCPEPLVVARTCCEQASWAAAGARVGLPPAALERARPEQTRTVRALMCDPSQPARASATLRYREQARMARRPRQARSLTPAARADRLPGENARKSVATAPAVA